MTGKSFGQSAVELDSLDLDRLYANDLVTCRMYGIELVPCERALGFIVEWTEVLTGRPEPTRH